MFITATQARERVQEIEEKFRQGTRRYQNEGDVDADLEETGFQAPGAAAGYFEIPLPY